MVAVQPDTAGSPTPGDSSSSSHDDGPKVVLPTLPELLSFIVSASNGRVALTPDAEAAAAALESEAQEIEQAYALALNYMELWHAYHTTVLAETEGDALNREGVAKAAELRRRIIRVYGFITEEGGPGTIERIVELLQSVSDWAEESGILADMQQGQGHQSGAIIK